jgi:hypothetical protein
MTEPLNRGIAKSVLSTSVDGYGKISTVDIRRHLSVNIFCILHTSESIRSPGGEHLPVEAS